MAFPMLMKKRLLDELWERASKGQRAPSLRLIAKSASLASEDEALRLLREMKADGPIDLVREGAYPIIRAAWGTPWAISYQDAASTHRGNLYRYDGWVILGYSKSGSDSRAGSRTAKVRHKVIWGWNAAAPAMACRRANAPEAPAWAERLAA